MWIKLIEQKIGTCFRCFGRLHFRMIKQLSLCALLSFHIVQCNFKVLTNVFKKPVNILSTISLDFHWIINLPVSVTANKYNLSTKVFCQSSAISGPAISLFLFITDTAIVITTHLAWHFAIYDWRVSFQTYFQVLEIK